MPEGIDRSDWKIITLTKKVTAMVNFIKHFRATMYRFSEDSRCSASHRMLYMALFDCWNRNRFYNPVSINREEVMRLSGIGSIKLYYIYIKDLAEWGYIEYHPSKSIYRGSKVVMRRYDLTEALSEESSEESSESSSGDQLGVPSINDINTLNKSNTSKLVNGQASDHINNMDEIPTAGRTPEAVVSKKEGRGGGRPAAVPGSEDEVRAYFTERRSSWEEADRFYNHYESVGWLMGGRTPVVNWQACARYWIANADQFAARRPKVPFQPNLTGPKNYAKPL